MSTSVTNEVDFTTIPAPGGTMVVTYFTSGPGGPQLNLPPLSSTYALGDDPGGTGMNNTGKIILTPVGGTVPTAIVYMINAAPPPTPGGTTDRTNNKWVSINIATPSGAADPNPRLTVVQSTTK